MNADESRIIKEATGAGLIALTKKQYYTRLTIAAAVGAAIAGGIVHLLSGSGDEPPIRVKGGSIYLDLLHADGSWELRGGKWHVAGGSRSSDDLLIYLGAKDPARCGGQVVRKKEKKIRFVYHNADEGEGGKDHDVLLHATGKKTKVESTLPFSWAAGSPTVLSNSSTGYIKEIWVGNDSQATCAFASGDQLDSVLIAEE
jgi:hypothetical protein